MYSSSTFAFINIKVLNCSKKDNSGEKITQWHSKCLPQAEVNLKKQRKNKKSKFKKIAR